MAQINVTVDNNLASAVERLASAKSVSRPELLRQMMQEMIEAHDAGRLAFTHDDGPKLDSSLNTLALQLREAVVEIDRSQRENQKLAKRLIDAWNGGEEAAQIAQRQLTEKIKAHLGDGYAPFHERVTELVSLMEAMPGNLSASQEQRFGQMHAKLQSIEKLASEPRFIRNLVVGREFVREWPVMATVSSLWFLTGILTLLIAANFLPGLGQSLANQFVDTDATLCRQLNDRFEVQDCALPDLKRRNALNTISLEDQP
jgi:hypothetical protein